MAEGDGLDPEHCPAEHDQQGPEADEASVTDTAGRSTARQAA